MAQLARFLGVVMALLPCLAGATTLSPGDIVVSGTGGSSAGLLRVDPVTGAQTLIAPGSFGDFALLGTSTIYALAGSSVVEVDATSGSQHVVSSGGGLVAPSGIAVDGSGHIFVMDGAAQGGAGAIFQIDPATGSQSVLTSGGFFDSSTLALSGNDLEISPTGDLIVLYPGQGSSHVGSVWSIAQTTGIQTSLFSDPLEYYLAGTTGLGVAPNGDIYVSNGMFQGTQVMKIDAITGETTVAGHNFVGGDFTDQLLSTDIAILGSGIGFMTGSGLSGSGVYRWDVNPDGSPLSAGSFNEVEIVPVPEPSTGALYAVGLLLVALRARRPAVARSRGQRPGVVVNCPHLDRVWR